MPKQELLPVQPEAQAPSRVDPLQYAIQHGADPATLEKMMELQERWEANEARKAYNAAMAAFKADPPHIKKDRHVAFETTRGKTAYSHATLGNVVEVVSAALSKHGLAATWKTSTGDKGEVTVTCRITHSLGHHEETSLTSAPDASGGKNSIQAIGSAVSYLSRYTILSLCGLATYEQDDDGAGTATEHITEDQASTIYNLCNDIGGTTLARMLKWLHVEEVTDIEAKHFDRVIAELKRQKGAK